MPSRQEVNDIGTRIEGINRLGRKMTALAAISFKEIVATSEVMSTCFPMFEALSEPFEVLLRQYPLLVEQHPLVLNRDNQSGPIAYVIIGTDRALCGSHNDNLVEKVHEFEGQDTRPITYYVIGSQIYDQISGRGRNIVGPFPSTSPEKTTSLAEFSSVSRPLLSEYRKGMYAGVYVIYYQRESQPLIRQMLPIVFDASSATDRRAGFTFEPNALEVLDWLLPTYFNLRFYVDYLTSSLQEFEARKDTANNAKMGARKLDEVLTIEQHRLNLALTTAQVIELDNNS